MARPVGQFDAMKDALYRELQWIAGLGACWATSRYLAKRMKRGEQQVNRYIKALQKEGRISVVTSKPRFDPAKGTWYKRRVIRLTVNEGGIAKSVPLRRYSFSSDWDEVELPPHETNLSTAEIEAALEATSQEEARVAADKAFSDSLNPDKQFDVEATLRELREEYSRMGITMEI